MHERRLYTDEELRSAVNASGPTEALEITLSLFQRMTLALESIAESMKEPPTVLFEQAPTTDGLDQGDDDKSH